MALPHATKENFRSLVLESSAPVVIDFYADWCGPCHQIAPAVDALARKWQGEFEFLKLNTEHDPEVAAAYRITTIPAILLFEGGEVRGWSVGAKPAHVIESELGLARRARSRAGDERIGALQRVMDWWNAT